MGVRTAIFLAALAVLALAFVACGTAESGGVEGPSLDAEAQNDASIAEDSTVTGPHDVQQDSGSLDTGPVDSGPVDTGPVDTGPVDSGPIDTGPVDTGPPDTGPPDTGPADTKGSLCAGYVSKFTSVAKTARQCTTPFSCTELAAAGVACKTCDRYYSHDAAANVQAVHDVASEAAQKKCEPACPTPCMDPKKHVGVCGADKQCTFDAPSCQEIEKRFKAVIVEALKCTSDAQCAFQAQTSLPCGCGAYLNVKTFGPGKSMFRYAKMLVTVYNAQKCFTGDCACAQFSKAKCNAGVCESLQ